MNSRSAQDHRSALEQEPSDSWSVVSKKPKSGKHKSTTAVHQGYTIIMKNNYNGIEQIFTSDKPIKNSRKRFSPLNDDE
jgi:hypothetical protein